MCNYQGYEFGAGRYPDSVCFDGSLHDADNCDGDGNVYLNDEDVPCPICRPKDAIDWWYSQWEGSTHGDDEDPDWNAVNTKHRERAISLVTDIRRNRGFETPQGMTA